MTANTNPQTPAAQAANTPPNTAPTHHDSAAHIWALGLGMSAGVLGMVAGYALYNKDVDVRKGIEKERQAIIQTIQEGYRSDFKALEDRLNERIAKIDPNVSATIGQSGQPTPAAPAQEEPSIWERARGAWNDYWHPNVNDQKAQQKTTQSAATPSATQPQTTVTPSSQPAPAAAVQNAVTAATQQITSAYKALKFDPCRPLSLLPTWLSYGEQKISLKSEGNIHVTLKKGESVTLNQLPEQSTRSYFALNRADGKIWESYAKATGQTLGVRAPLTITYDDKLTAAMGEKKQLNLVGNVINQHKDGVVGGSYRTGVSVVLEGNTYQPFTLDAIAKYVVNCAETATKTVQQTARTVAASDAWKPMAFDLSAYKKATRTHVQNEVNLYGSAEAVNTFFRFTPIYQGSTNPPQGTGLYQWTWHGIKIQPAKEQTRNIRIAVPRAQSQLPDLYSRPSQLHLQQFTVLPPLGSAQIVQDSQKAMDDARRDLDEQQKNSGPIRFEQRVLAPAAGAFLDHLRNQSATYDPNYNQ
jgi:hypothetical protein